MLDGPVAYTYAKNLLREVPAYLGLSRATCKLGSGALQIELQTVLSVGSSTLIYIWHETILETTQVVERVLYP